MLKSFINSVEAVCLLAKLRKEHRFDRYHGEIIQVDDEYIPVYFLVSSIIENLSEGPQIENIFTVIRLSIVLVRYLIMIALIGGRLDRQKALL